MSIEVTSLDQLEVGTVLERNWSGNTTHWVVKAIQPFPNSQGIMSVYADRVRKSDHKVIIRGSNGLATYSTVLAHFSMVWNRTTQKIGQLGTNPYTLTVIESKQAVEQPEKVHAVGSGLTGGVVVATTQARCNKKFVRDGMTVSSNWEEVTCGSCLKQYIRHDGKKNSPLTLLEYEHEYVTKVGEMEEEERLSICCGADEDENIENMCSACHESTTFTGEEETPSPEPEEEDTLFVHLTPHLGKYEPETPKTPTFEEAMTVAHEKIQKELTAVKLELETESRDANGTIKKALWWPATERRLLEKKHTLEGKMYGLIYAESTFTLTQPEETPSPVKFETVVHSNMNQLIGELSGAVAYLEDMNISNEDTGLIDQSQGLYKAIRNAKNIASALRQDAIDRKEINMK